MMKPVLIEPSVNHSRGKNLIVKKALNSENEGAYSDQELSSAKDHSEKKGSQTSRNEPTSRMVEDISKGQASNDGGFTFSTDTSSKMK